MLPASDNGNSPKQNNARQHSRLEIDGEPDLLNGTLEEWHIYRKSLSALPQEDENVRVAIAVADARIARLKGND